MSESIHGYQPLPGSRREAPPDSRRVADADADAPVDVIVVLRRRAGGGPPSPATVLPRSEFAARLGADPADVAALEEFAHAHGLSVTSVDVAARSVGLTGTVEQMQAAFQVRLGQYQDAGQTFRGREGDIHVPVELAPAVVAVLGLDERPQARAHFRMRDAGGQAAPAAAAVTPTSYPPQEVARRYSFPTDADGTGQTVAIIELGGGYHQSDLHTYFTAQGLRTPRLTAVSVDGARNKPGDPADGEVALDIEVIGAVAQGAALAVYFAPNTTRGFYDGIAAAIHDQLRRPTVVSISWGGAEQSWTAQAMDSYDQLFADAAALGVSVYCASGDDGSTDRVQNGGDWVDFPAASPHVVGCGGTTLTAGDETVWNELATGHGASGGGVSRHFPPPAYQAGAQVPANPDGHPGRGVPDVCGDADPLTGYTVRVDGKDTVIGGTSAVAPLWAGLTAIANQKLGRPIGAPHDGLYGKVAAAGAFRDIVTGDNGSYSAGPGWDACTGLGSPHADKVIEALR